MIWILLIALLIPSWGYADSRTSMDPSFSAIESRKMGDFSPDGNSFLMADYHSGEIWVYHFGRERFKKLATLQREIDGKQLVRVMNPRWAADQSMIIFESFNDTAERMENGQIWKMREDGTQFVPLASISFPPNRNQHPEYATPFLGDMEFVPGVKNITYTSWNPDSKLNSMYSISLDGQDQQKFLWQNGLIGSRWSPNQKHLAYVVEPAPEDSLGTETQPKAKVDHQQRLKELWVTSSDGGQLRKMVSGVYFPKDPQGIPFEWSPDSKWIGYFREEIDEKLKTFRELQIQNPDKTDSQVLFRTWGKPTGPMKWSADKKWIAFMEEPAHSIGLQQLVILKLRKQKGVWVPKGKEIRVNVNRGSALVGWDLDQKKYIYVLDARRNGQGNYYSLLKVHRTKEKPEEILPFIPPHIIFNYDTLRRQISLCHRKAGCQMVTTPKGDVRSLQPDFSTMATMGDFLVQIGAYDAADQQYKSVDALNLERDEWIQIMTRRYLAAKLLQDTEKSKEISQLIRKRLDRGEAKSTEYNLWADTLLELGLAEDAISKYKVVLDGFPDTMESRHALLQSGIAYREAGQFVYAANCFGNFAKSYAKDPRFSKALNELGETYLMQDQPGKAIKVFRKVTSIADQEDRLLDAYLGKARALEKMNRYEEARKTYRLVVDREDQSDSSHWVQYKQARAALSRLER